MVKKEKIKVKERVTDGKVDLSMSDLDDVPVKDIVALKKIYSLDLSDNRLLLLPSSFTTLTFLIMLDLSKNELKELPEDFGMLSKLQYLDLYKNNLERLPLSFGQLSALKFLDLKDNPLVPAVANVAGSCEDHKGCQQCAKNIVRFFKELQVKIDEEIQINKNVEIEENVAENKKIEKRKRGKKLKNKKIVQETPESRDDEFLGKKIKADNVTRRAKGKCVRRGCLLIFVALILWMLCSVKHPLTAKIGVYLEHFLSKLPANCQLYIRVFSDFIIKSQNYTREMLVYCKNWIYENDLFQRLISKLNN
ncbi:hypothetical protein ABEB36_001741 [Hypothenemus hampei]|uniref:Leucine-rich repeat-containing protein 59 n=1 Tax=Hypothenemus hampei TaxID=57062 RepID=A0ABD1FGK7_HYPHA